MQCERIADITLLPVRAWVYRWVNCWGDRGHFLLVRPEKYFGVYDTNAIPVDDGGAVDSLFSLVPDGAKLIHRGQLSRQGSSVPYAEYQALVRRVESLEVLVEQLRAYIYSQRVT